MTQLSLDTTAIKAEVYAYNTNKQIHFVKVTIPDLNLYINSITVRPSKKEVGPWFQMPAIFAGGKMIRPIELPKSSILYSIIRDLTMRAVVEYSQAMPEDLLSDDEYSRQLGKVSNNLSPL